MIAEIKQGDCREVMATMAAESIDAIVCDPPYGLSFMGKGWDHGVPGVEFWTEALRVAKPGAHLLAFGGTRTYHRLAVAIEDAGWEIRDCVMWVYGSGFPKSHNVSKAIDRDAGVLKAEGKGFTVAGYSHAPDKLLHTAPSRGYISPAPATDASRQWFGWGTALKPAWEPIIVARKPLAGTVAENVLRYGTGGLNVDGCRVEIDSSDDIHAKNPHTENKGKNGGWCTSGSNGAGYSIPSGRWPANLIHDGSEEVVGLFPESDGVVGSHREGGDKSIFSGGGHKQASKQRIVGGVKDSGSAARFFYCAKASKADRDEGCEKLEAIHRANGNKWTDQDYRVTNGERPPSAESGPHHNFHPTVKPTSLMRYLCRLVTPPGGVILDPFMGSGSTGKAAVIEGFRFVGIEREPEYAEIAAARIKHANENKESYRGDGKCGSRISGGNRNAISFVSNAGNIGNAIAESGVGRGLHGGQSGKKLHAEAFVRQMEIDFYDKQ